VIKRSIKNIALILLSVLLPKGLLAMAGNVTNQQTLPMTVGVTYY